jgi:hypothetical protein
VIGRKNYYGSHAQWAPYLTATVWTITTTAERTNQEPLTYLSQHLQACALTSDKPPEVKPCNDSCPGYPTPATPPAAATTIHHHQSHPNRPTPASHPSPHQPPGTSPDHTTGRILTMPFHATTEYLQQSSECGLVPGR